MYFLFFILGVVFWLFLIALLSVNLDRSLEDKEQKEYIENLVKKKSKKESFKEEGNSNESN